MRNPGVEDMDQNTLLLDTCMASPRLMRHTVALQNASESTSRRRFCCTAYRAVHQLRLPLTVALTCLQTGAGACDCTCAGVDCTRFYKGCGAFIRYRERYSESVAIVLVLGFRPSCSQRNGALNNEAGERFMFLQRPSSKVLFTCSTAAVADGRSRLSAKRTNRATCCSKRGNTAVWCLQSAEPPALAPSGGVFFAPAKLKLFAGSSNKELAFGVARYLGKEGPDELICKNFADGEKYVRLVQSVRGCNVFILQSTCQPVNENLIELLLMIDACRRAHAFQIIAVIPYSAYARADRIFDLDSKRREALTSKLVANLICESGADRVILVDIHSPQSCGFFDIPVEHIYASPVLVDYVQTCLENLGNIIIVSPDIGGVARARAYAKALGDAPLAIVDKRRDSRTKHEVMNLVGDVAGKVAIVVDDMIDTAATVYSAGQLLRSSGAAKVLTLATHAVFSEVALKRVSSGLFEEVIVTDTVPVPPEKQFPQLRVVSCANLIGEAIWRVHEETAHAL